MNALAKDKEGELAEDSEGIAELLQEVFLWVQTIHNRLGICRFDVELGTFSEE